MELVPEKALKLRSLAARMRAHSAETHVEFYRRKFKMVASELEEAALDVESRVRRADLRRVS